MESGLVRACLEHCKSVLFKNTAYISQSCRETKREAMTVTEKRLYFISGETNVIQIDRY